MGREETSKMELQNLRKFYESYRDPEHHTTRSGEMLVAGRKDMGRLIHVTQPGLTRAKPNQSNDVHTFKTLDACHISASLEQIDT
jgi:hypothetical protein